MKYAKLQTLKLAGDGPPAAPRDPLHSVSRKMSSEKGMEKCPPPSTPTTKKKKKKTWLYLIYSHKKHNLKKRNLPPSFCSDCFSSHCSFLCSQMRADAWLRPRIPPGSAQHLQDSCLPLKTPQPSMKSGEYGDFPH